jgi:hypothetical protein
MSETVQEHAVYVGGPLDGQAFDADGASLIEAEIDGMVHRYVHTTKHREIAGHRRVVYNYDGEVDPSGAQSGIETR